MQFKKLKYTGYKNGGCVPYLIANMTDSDTPIKGLDIDESTSFDEYDASNMFCSAMDAKVYFKAILAKERFIDIQKIKALNWIEYPEFAKASTIKPIAEVSDGESVIVLLFEVFTKTRLLHAIGGFYNPKEGTIILIDPAKPQPVKMGIDIVFLRYKVMKVCPLFFEATKLVLYPVENLSYLYEPVDNNVKSLII